MPRTKRTKTHATDPGERRTWCGRSAMEPGVALADPLDLPSCTWCLIALERSILDQHRARAAG